jgi:hypothetical protein
MCLHLNDSPNEIQISTRHNLVGRRMNRPAASVVAQQYISAAFSSVRSYSRAEKFGVP